MGIYFFCHKPLLLLKIPALFLLISFSVSQVTYAVPDGAQQSAERRAHSVTERSQNALRSALGAMQIEIPSELGTVEEFHRGSSAKTMIYIQDAHDSLEAQENIAKLIRYYVERYHVKTVFEEGYEGPVPTEKYFGFIKDPALKQKISYFLMDQLRLSGAEYAHVNRHSEKSIAHSEFKRSALSSMRSAEDFGLIGADSLKEHSANIRAYQKTAHVQKKTQKELSALEKDIEELANRYFPNDLKIWMKEKERFDRGEMDMARYLRRIGFPMEQIEKIPTEEIFKMIYQLEENGAQSFLTNERDQKIFRFDQALKLLMRLNKIEVSEAEYNAAKTWLEKIRTEDLADFIVKETHRSRVYSKSWETQIREATEFYEIARRRDRVIENALLAHGSLLMVDGKKRQQVSRRYEPSAMNYEQPAPAVLVFGGFHKEAIKEILSRQGYSYYVVTPRITGASKRHQDYYKELMSVDHHPFELSLGLLPRANSPNRVFNIYEPSKMPELLRLAMAYGEFDSELLARELTQTSRQSSAFSHQPERDSSAEVPQIDRRRSEIRNQKSGVGQLLDKLSRWQKENLVEKKGDSPPEPQRSEMRIGGALWYRDQLKEMKFIPHGSGPGKSSVEIPSLVPKAVIDLYDQERLRTPQEIVIQLTRLKVIHDELQHFARFSPSGSDSIKAVDAQGNESIFSYSEPKKLASSLNHLLDVCREVQLNLPSDFLASILKELRQVPQDDLERVAKVLVRMKGVNLYLQVFPPGFFGVQLEKLHTLYDLALNAARNGHAGVLSNLSEAAESFLKGNANELQVYLEKMRGSFRSEARNFDSTAILKTFGQTGQLPESVEISFINALYRQYTGDLWLWNQESVETLLTDQHFAGRLMTTPDVYSERSKTIEAFHRFLRSEETKDFFITLATNIPISPEGEKFRSQIKMIPEVVANVLDPAYLRDFLYTSESDDPLNWTLLGDGAVRKKMEVAKKLGWDENDPVGFAFCRVILNPFMEEILFRELIPRNLAGIFKIDFKKAQQESQNVFAHIHPYQQLGNERLLKQSKNLMWARLTSSVFDAFILHAATNFKATLKRSETRTGVAGAERKTASESLTNSHPLYWREVFAPRKMADELKQQLENEAVEVIRRLIPAEKLVQRKVTVEQLAQKIVSQTKFFSEARLLLSWMLLVNFSMVTLGALMSFKPVVEFVRVHAASIRRVEPAVFLTIFQIGMAALASGLNLNLPFVLRRIYLSQDLDDESGIQSVFRHEMTHWLKREGWIKNDFITMAVQIFVKLERNEKLKSLDRHEAFEAGRQWMEQVLASGSIRKIKRVSSRDSWIWSFELYKKESYLAGVAWALHQEQIKRGIQGEDWGWIFLREIDHGKKAYPAFLTIEKAGSRQELRMRPQRAEARTNEVKKEISKPASMTSDQTKVDAIRPGGKVIRELYEAIGVPVKDVSVQSDQVKRLSSEILAGRIEPVWGENMDLQVLIEIYKLIAAKLGRWDEQTSVILDSQNSDALRSWILGRLYYNTALKSGKFTHLKMFRNLFYLSPRDTTHNLFSRAKVLNGELLKRRSDSVKKDPLFDELVQLVDYLQVNFAGPLEAFFLPWEDDRPKTASYFFFNAPNEFSDWDSAFVVATKGLVNEEEFSLLFHQKRLNNQILALFSIALMNKNADHIQDYIAQITERFSMQQSLVIADRLLAIQSIQGFIRQIVISWKESLLSTRSEMQTKPSQNYRDIKDFSAPEKGDSPSVTSRAEKRSQEPMSNFSENPYRVYSKETLEELIRIAKRDGAVFAHALSQVGKSSWIRKEIDEHQAPLMFYSALVDGPGHVQGLRKGMADRLSLAKQNYENDSTFAHDLKLKLDGRVLVIDEMSNLLWGFDEFFRELVLKEKIPIIFLQPSKYLYAFQIIPNALSEILGFEIQSVPLLPPTKSDYRTILEGWIRKEVNFCKKFAERNHYAIPTDWNRLVMKIFTLADSFHEVSGGHLGVTKDFLSMFTDYDGVILVSAREGKDVGVELDKLLVTIHSSQDLVSELFKWYRLNNIYGDYMENIEDFFYSMDKSNLPVQVLGRFENPVEEKIIKGWPEDEKRVVQNLLSVGLLTLDRQSIRQRILYVHPGSWRHFFGPRSEMRGLFAGFPKLDEVIMKFREVLRDQKVSFWDGESNKATAMTWFDALEQWKNTSGLIYSDAQEKDLTASVQQLSDEDFQRRFETAYKNPHLGLMHLGNNTLSDFISLTVNKTEPPSLLHNFFIVSQDEVNIKEMGSNLLAEEVEWKVLVRDLVRRWHIAHLSRSEVRSLPANPLEKLLESQRKSLALRSIPNQQ